MSKKKSTHLGVKEVYASGWEVFKANYKPLLLLAALPALIPFVMGFVMASLVTNIDETGVNFLTTGLGIFAVLFIILSVLASLFVSIFAESASVSSLLKYGKKSFDFNTAVELGKKNFKRFLVVSLWVLLYVLGGLILLIIPGLLFAIWYAFAPVIVLDQKVDAKQAMAKSKEIVQANIGALVKLALVFIALSILVSAFVSEAGLLEMLLNIILSAFGAALYIDIYKRITN